jgi:hypothetical protein
MQENDGWMKSPSGPGGSYGGGTYPNHSPWAEGRGIVWINFELFKVESQKTLGRGDGQIALENTGVKYKFMAPNEIMESIQHSWEEYDSMNSKLSQLMVSAGNAIGDVAGSLSSIFKGGSSVDARNFAASRTQSTVMNRQKADTPLVYKNSQRREYTFEFELMAYSDAYNEVYKPVEELRYYSCPGLKTGDSISFDLPYVFKVTSLTGSTTSSTTTKSFLFMEVAALVSLQPTFKGPYIDGFPMHCTLQLTFREIPPLFRDNFYSSLMKGYVDTSKTSGGKTTPDSTSSTPPKNTIPPANKGPSIFDTGTNPQFQP